MSQEDALALIYSLARKSIEDPTRQGTVVRRIVGIIEENFMERKRGLNVDAA